jgi:diguanylate cyclase (GGDEF)-like protein/PAS domain S-box-containing protein
MKLNPFRRGILFGTVVSIVTMAIMVGAIFILVSSVLTADGARQDSLRRLGELLDTVESTASVACFIGDAQLANELIGGLMKTREIAKVSVRAEGQELAHAEREGATGEGAALALSRKIMSPFIPDQVIGEVYLEPDAREIEAKVRQQVRTRILLLGFQLLVIVGTVIVIVLFVIVRPIRALSEGLHHLDARVGEKLLPPKGHEQNEIAGLTDDINALASTLVDALKEEQALRRKRELDEQKYRNIFENAASGIFIANDDGRIFSFNHAFSRLTRLADTPAGDHSKLAHIPWRHPQPLLDMIERCVAECADQSGEFELATQPPRWLNISVTCLGEHQVQGVVTDVSQSKQSEAIAMQMAVTDPLTGLSNRQGLERHLPEMILHHPHDSLALMVVDIQGFKQINESMGMAAGDTVLKVVASRLSGCVKSTDWLARVGGDEFVIALHGMSTREAAARVVNRIIDTLGKPYEISAHHHLSLTCHVGIAFYPVDGRDLPTLLREAGFALAHARSSDSKGFKFFEAAMVEIAEQRYRLEEELRHTIRQGQLQLYYQPIIELAENRLVGAEALIRWNHPERGMIPPDEFIPLAEESGFIREMGIWVLETACKQLASWQALGHPFYITVNVSTSQIPEWLPLALIEEVADRYGVDHNSLVLEITESVLLSDIEKGLSWIQGLRDAGFHVYLDDFGTGYSSLSYLKRFPVDAVKIDKSFVREMKENASDRALVGAIIAMAHALGLVVIAEGVESKGQIALLGELGCNRGQGYYFSKPLPAEVFLERLL